MFDESTAHEPRRHSSPRPSGGERLSLQALHWDLVVASGTELPKPFDAWNLRYVAQPFNRHSGEPLALIQPFPEQRPTYEPIPPDAFRLRASENEHLLPAVLDPSPTTFWTSS